MTLEQYATKHPGYFAGSDPIFSRWNVVYPLQMADSQLPPFPNAMPCCSPPTLFSLHPCFKAGIFGTYLMYCLRHMCCHWGLVCCVVTAAASSGSIPLLMLCQWITVGQFSPPVCWKLPSSLGPCWTCLYLSPPVLGLDE
jgi:hypothetical protein